MWNHEIDIEMILVFDRLTTKLITKYNIKTPTTANIKRNKWCLFVPPLYVYVTSCQITLIEMYKEVWQNETYNRICDKFKQVNLTSLKGDRYKNEINYVKRITSKKSNEYSERSRQANLGAYDQPSDNDDDNNNWETENIAIV